MTFKKSPFTPAPFQPKNDNNSSSVRNLNRDFCRACVHSAIRNTVNNVYLLPVYYMQMI